MKILVPLQLVLARNDNEGKVYPVRVRDLGLLTHLFEVGYGKREQQLYTYVANIHLKLDNKMMSVLVLLVPYFFIIRIFFIGVVRTKMGKIKNIL